MGAHNHEDDIPVGKIALFFLACIVGVFFLGYSLDWFGAGAKIVSAQHVEEQFAVAYQGYANLKKTAQQVCIAEKAVSEARATGDTAVFTQRQSQLIAIASNYSRIAGDYDAEMQNVFKGKLVAPSELPKTAPPLAEMKSQVCK